MSKKMLIDATHPEETRVVVVDGTKVEEFDFETINKRQLAGNIYLAKVTRIEPSLQAAFVDYGGNRHGFLAFAEIHPDYYQIPAADRQALIAEEQAAAAAADKEEQTERKPSRRRRSSRAEKANIDAVVKSDAIPGMEIVDPNGDDHLGAPTEFVGLIEDPAEPAEVAAVETAVAETASALASDEDAGESAAADDANCDESAEAASNDAESEDDGIESIAEEDVIEEIRPHKSKPRHRRYKIQEVIKVRQIMLVQVVKEERGNKGAALTTYLSLAGRYCVLMPNTARGGGISRKITNAADRKKLKEIASELSVPEGAGLIIRTAGSQRTRTEIKRDYEYLMRLWEQIRELTFKSTAPAPVYEEGDLIKRTIRDIYSKEIDEVLVEGDRGYRTAKDFMKMIMPSHAKNVKHYADAMPLFSRYQVESYLGGMFNPVVQLKSGGYIVIGVTEALVAIDVNSGRATKEGSIEDTAYKTNCEAADEIARQLRLRDLAGLIVIDFIDMEERKNNAAVEKRFKDKLKTDRARIQVGRISGFGLLEMSRQRLRPGMLESTTQPCAHCHGTGLIRSDDSLALTILRAIEEEGTRKRSREVLVKAPVAVANFLMNQKREHIANIESRYGMSVRVEADPTLISPDFTLEKFKTATRSVTEALSPVVSVDAKLMAQIDDEEAEVEASDTEDDCDTDTTATTEGNDEDNGKSKRRRRRRRRNGRQTDGQEDVMNGKTDPDAGDDNVEATDDAAAAYVEGTEDQVDRDAVSAADAALPSEETPEMEEQEAQKMEFGDKPAAWQEKASEIPDPSLTKAAEIHAADLKTEEAEAAPTPPAPSAPEASASIDTNMADYEADTVDRTDEVAAQGAAAALPSEETPEAEEQEAEKMEFGSASTDSASSDAEASKPKRKGWWSKA